MSTSKAISKGGSEEEKKQENRSSGLGFRGLAGEHLVGPTGRGARAVCEPAGAGAAPEASGLEFC